MPNDINNSEDLIDVRDIIARVEELEAELEQTHADQGGEATFAEWVDAEWQPGEFNIEEVEEYRGLRGLLDDLKGYGGDEQWRGDWYPITLVRDSYFKEHAQDLAEDIGAINSDAKWPNNCIDWDKAASELQWDYSSIDFDGVTYWYR